MDSPDENKTRIGEDAEAFELLLADRETEAPNRSLADNTRRGYGSDWRDFTAWCALHEADPLPAVATTLKRYFMG